MAAEDNLKFNNIPVDPYSTKFLISHNNEPITASINKDQILRALDQAYRMAQIDYTNGYKDDEKQLNAVCEYIYKKYIEDKIGK